MTKEQNEKARIEYLKQQWRRSHKKATSAEFERYVNALRWVCR